MSVFSTVMAELMLEINLSKQRVVASVRGAQRFINSGHASNRFPSRTLEKTILRFTLYVCNEEVEEQSFEPYHGFPNYVIGEMRNHRMHSGLESTEFGH